MSQLSRQSQITQTNVAVAGISITLSGACQLRIASDDR